jgi:hypothetical protein
MGEKGRSRKEKRRREEVWGVKKVQKRVERNRKGEGKGGRGVEKGKPFLE